MGRRSDAVAAMAYFLLAASSILTSDGRSVAPVWPANAVMLFVVLNKQDPPSDAKPAVAHSISYMPEVIDVVVQDYDGQITAGGRFAYPNDCYVHRSASPSLSSDHFEVERALVEGLLERDKPVLGIRAGMQMLACLHGCRLPPDLRQQNPDAIEHNKKDRYHPIAIVGGSHLGSVIGQVTLEVNRFHREAIAQRSSNMVASARAPDGTVEAVEIPGRRFAIGL